MRLASAALASVQLAACATAPRSKTDFASGGLSLCPGEVSNAPEIDGARRIVGYDAHVVIRGVRLARAPVAACLSSGFGPRAGGAGKFHRGIDLFTRAPSAVYASAAGVVESAGAASGYGETILIRHGSGVMTRYAHLSSYGPRIARGARLRAGEVLGATGATGNATAVHLHYEILIDGDAVNPLTIGR